MADWPKLIPELGHDWLQDLRGARALPPGFAAIVAQASQAPCWPSPRMALARPGSRAHAGPPGSQAERVPFPPPPTHPPTTLLLHAHSQCPTDWAERLHVEDWPELLDELPPDWLELLQVRGGGGLLLGGAGSVGLVPAGGALR